MPSLPADPARRPFFKEGANALDRIRIAHQILQVHPLERRQFVFQRVQQGDGEQHGPRSAEQKPSGAGTPSPASRELGFEFSGSRRAIHQTDRRCRRSVEAGSGSAPELAQGQRQCAPATTLKLRGENPKLNLGTAEPCGFLG